VRLLHVVCACGCAWSWFFFTVSHPFRSIWMSRNLL